MLNPHRDANGYRIYSDEDVAFLIRLKKMVDEGLAISMAVRALRGISATENPQIAPTRFPATDLRAAMLRALLAFDRSGVDQLARELEHLSFERAIDELYLPILVDIGSAWEHRTITKAQEHFASAMCREHLLGMFHRLGAGPEDGVRVACATLPGEHHDLGLLCLAIRLALRGCRVTWLSTNLPFEDLATFLAMQPQRLLCLSVGSPPSAAEVLAFAAQNRKNGNVSTIVAIGGAGVGELEPHSTDDCWFCPDLTRFWGRWTEALQRGSSKTATVRDAHQPTP
jgi:DNA-binding transcriptional MerR regulator